MPELPEVETIRRGIEDNTAGHTVVRVITDDSRVFRGNPNTGRDVEELACGRRVLGLGRRGKFMWLEFEGANSAVVIHLGMSGRVLFDSSSNIEIDKHEHMRLVFDSGSVLRFIDPRMFGHVTVSDFECSIPVAIAHIAPDYFEEAFDEVGVRSRIKKSRRPIKTLLLDQSIASGVGNIYADEALFRAKIHGSVPGGDLSDTQISSIFKGAKDAMSAALEVGGTSFDSMYVDATGNPGYFSRQLAVYGKADESCLECGNAITKVIIDGRSHYSCAVCQVH